MRTRYLLYFAILGALEAQPPVAPTPETVGSTRGENVGNYNYTNSFETGYRFALIDGNLGKYRSDVNYRNGIRLLSSGFGINSKDGHGRFFDEIVLNTLGQGNDPYQSAVLRIQKNSLYRYDMMWRLNEYYNPGLTVAAGEHLMDTRRRLQDHDLTLLPQSRIKFRAGYSRNTQTGPALSSVLEFDPRGSAFPVFTNVRREWNEYRVGADVELAGFKLTVLRRWEFYKDDSSNGGAGKATITTLGDPTAVTQFQRSEPYHGSSPGWVGNLNSTRKRWAVNGRITYVGGRRNFVMNEAALGTNRFGAAANRQIQVSGNAQRPVVAGNFSVSLFPTERLTVINSTGVHSTRIDGDSTYTEFNNATNLGTTLNFRYLGVRTVSNATDAQYRVSKWLGFYGGYKHSQRLIRTVEAFALPAFPDSGSRDAYERENRMHTGTAGIRIKPLAPLTILFDGEISRSDHPLTPVAERNYHTLGGRADYRAKKLQLSASYRQLYNINSPLPLSVYSSHSRNYSAGGSWTPNSWFALDASYMKLHLDTASGLAFFAGAGRPQLQQAYSSLYLSNIHSANLGAHFVILKRADLYAGYGVTRDAGDGRVSAVPAGVTDPIQALFSSVQTFPLSFHSPQARLSVKITSKVRWNAGWQFYRYREEFGLFSANQNYRANTGYTSVLWSF